MVDCRYRCKCHVTHRGPHCEFLVLKQADNYEGSLAGNPGAATYGFASRALDSETQALLLPGFETNLVLRQDELMVHQSDALELSSLQQLRQPCASAPCHHGGMCQSSPKVSTTPYSCQLNRCHDSDCSPYKNIYIHNSYRSSVLTQLRYLSRHNGVGVDGSASASDC